MTDRQILVMDNSNDLIEMIRDALVIYGFDAHLVEAGENGIHSVKSVRPEAVFVGAEQSDKSRLALCSKAKKSGGQSNTCDSRFIHYSADGFRFAWQTALSCGCLP